MSEMGYPEREDVDRSFSMVVPPDADLKAVAEHAIFGHDEVARTETAALAAAIDHVLDSLASGMLPDYGYLEMLGAFWNPDEPERTRRVIEEDGTTITYDKEGRELSRVPPSEEEATKYREQKKRRAALRSYVEQVSPGYTEELLRQLADPCLEEAKVSLRTERGRRIVHDGIDFSEGELVMAVLARTREELEGRYFTVRADNKVYSEDGRPKSKKSQGGFTQYTLSAAWTAWQDPTRRKKRSPYRA